LNLLFSQESPSRTSRITTRGFPNMAKSWSLVILWGSAPFPIPRAVEVIPLERKKHKQNAKKVLRGFISHLQKSRITGNPNSLLSG
jgi:hypothetical protein